VTIYIDSCFKAARRYKVESDSLVEVVLVHELAHLMTHRGFDRDNLSSSFWVNDVTRNGERLGNLLLFGQTLQSSKASASGDHFVFTGVLPVNGLLFHNREVVDQAVHKD
jgi:hypothetical protein